MDCLTGEALDYVKGSSDYTTAMRTLTDRFGEPHRLVQSYYIDLDEITPQTEDAPANVRGLRNTLSTFQSIERSIAAIKASFDQRVAFRRLLAKFPHNMAVDVLEKIVPEDKSTEPDNERFMVQMEHKIYVREMFVARTSPAAGAFGVESPFINSSTLAAETTPARPNRKCKASEPKSSAGKTPRPPPSSTPPTCRFCSLKHLSRDCQKYPTIHATGAGAGIRSVLYLHGLWP